MTVSVHDVAREIRRRQPGAGDVKVHKLLYFAQGVHLARAGEPLFRERIEAWSMGPVVADLWRTEKHGGFRPPEQALSSDEMLTVHEVLARYGHLTGKQLIRLTHREGPWVDVTEDPFQTEPSPEITVAAMHYHFEMLLKDEMEEASTSAERLVQAHPHYRLGVPPADASLRSAIDALR
jgi:uncharacterized phage-associated protein